MTRRLLNVLTGLSLLLCVVIVALRVVGHRSIWHVVYEGGRSFGDGWRRTDYHLQLWFGRITVARTEFTVSDPEQAEELAQHRHGRGFRRLRSTSLGMGAAKQPGHPLYAVGIRPYHRVRDGGGSRFEERSVSFPAWMPLAASAALPLASLVVHLRKRIGDSRRRRPGHCPACGYDLTGNVSGVCPECGTQSSGGQAVG